MAKPLHDPSAVALFGGTTSSCEGFVVKQEEIFPQQATQPPGVQEAEETQEKRSHPRFPVSLTADMLALKTRTRATGRVTDLAVGGCYVDTTNPFVEGTEVGVRLLHEGRQFQCRAYVIYAHSGMGMGLAFAGVTPEQAALLGDWLRRLRGQTPPDFSQSPEPQVAGDTAGQESESDLEQFSNLRRVVLELLTLLLNKRLLTESEADALHSKLCK
jgi:hypothetical protein